MSAVMKPATCKCGHKGKSKNPEFYQCGYCYYTARARSNRETAQKLRVRAMKLDEETRQFEEKSRDFRSRHPIRRGNHD